MREMRRRKRERERTGRGPLPAEQVASAQSHKVDLAGASGPYGGEEHLRRTRGREDEVIGQLKRNLLFAYITLLKTSNHFQLLQLNNHKEEKLHLVSKERRETKEV